MPSAEDKSKKRRQEARLKRKDENHADGRLAEGKGRPGLDFLVIRRKETVGPQVGGEK